MPAGIPEPPLTCQDCAHGLIRVERTKEYAYESCSFGYFFEPNGKRPICRDFSPQTEEQRAARAPYLNRPSIVWGAPLEYPGD